MAMPMMRSIVLGAWLLTTSGIGGCTGYDKPSTDSEMIAFKDDVEHCPPGLSQEQLFGILESAIRVSGGDPSPLRVKYELEVINQKCDYLVSAVSRTTTNHFSLLITRSGEIKTWPWCCEPNFFVPPKESEAPLRFWQSTENAVILLTCLVLRLRGGDATSTNGIDAARSLGNSFRGYSGAISLRRGKDSRRHDRQVYPWRALGETGSGGDDPQFPLVCCRHRSSHPLGQGTGRRVVHLHLRRLPPMDGSRADDWQEATTVDCPTKISASTVRRRAKIKVIALTRNGQARSFPMVGLQAYDDEMMRTTHGRLLWGE